MLAAVERTCPRLPSATSPATIRAGRQPSESQAHRSSPALGGAQERPAGTLPALALVASLTDGRTLVRRTVPADGARDLAIALVAALHRDGITDVAVRLVDGAGAPLFVAQAAGGAL